MQSATTLIGVSHLILRSSESRIKIGKMSDIQIHFWPSSETPLGQSSSDAKLVLTKMTTEVA
jgi:hypothetical protein